MKFSVHSDIFDRFPDLILGVVVVSGIENRKQNMDLQRKIREREEEIQQNFLSETLSKHPNIQAWRLAYSTFGAKPKKYKSSVEGLFRMVLKGKELRSINTLVDIYTDEKEVLCRRWNWRECDKTKMMPETQNAVLVLEGLPPVRQENIEFAAEDLSVLVRNYCGGEGYKFFLDVSQKEAEFSFFH